VFYQVGWFRTEKTLSTENNSPGIPGKPVVEIAAAADIFDL
jgi:hypothetical protein